jgi:hypothetical protein
LRTSLLAPWQPTGKLQPAHRRFFREKSAILRALTFERRRARKCCWPHNRTRPPAPYRQACAIGSDRPPRGFRESGERELQLLNAIFEQLRKKRYSGGSLTNRDGRWERHNLVANSRYLQNALASRIRRGVRHSASNTRGDATTTQMHCAREVATFRRCREIPFPSVRPNGWRSSSNRSRSALPCPETCLPSRCGRQECAPEARKLARCRAQ